MATKSPEMDGLLPPTSEKASYIQRKGRQPRWRLLIVLALFSLVVLSWLSHPRPRPCHTEGRVLSYPGEHITWEPCGDVDGALLECSAIDVPMDQFNATNSGSKTFNVALVRLRGAEDATQNLLLNPGGPGGSGYPFLHETGRQLRGLVGDGFHLLSFDPRGVNATNPAASCYPDEETRRRLSPVREGKFIDDSPELFAWAQNYARACADNMGEHGKYINTPQTAADMNSILDAVGQADMYYWGFSYGTLLGQTYATLFPERSKRVIIDGVVNQFEWYEGKVEAEAYVDAERVFDGFFDECIKAGMNCSLSAFGKSKEELWGKVTALFENLREQPIPVYINSSAHGLFSYQSLVYNGIRIADYDPLEAWLSLADRLAELLEGNATAAFLAYGDRPPAFQLTDATHFITLNDGVSGSSYWPHGRDELLEQVVPMLNQTIFGPYREKFYFIKQHWVVPRTHSYVPRRGVRTAHPLLILSTSWDPTCPLTSARTANQAFKDSKLVEIVAYGHCSLAAVSKCANRHVRDFLYEGKLPEENTKCEVESTYFAASEDGAEGITGKRVLEWP